MDSPCTVMLTLVLNFMSIEHPCVLFCTDSFDVALVYWPWLSVSEDDQRTCQDSSTPYLNFFGTHFAYVEVMSLPGSSPWQQHPTSQCHVGEAERTGEQEGWKVIGTLKAIPQRICSVQFEWPRLWTYTIFSIACCCPSYGDQNERRLVKL